MKEIPLKVVERQSLSALLDGSLYELTIKECDGIMAATIIRDGITLVENRHVCAGMTLIPEGHLEEGNFAFITDNDNIPYYTRFGSTDILLYATAAEVEAYRAQGISTGPQPNSIPSGPLTDFDYLYNELSYGLSLTRASVGTYISGSSLLTAAINIPRFESNGLLIEPASSNLCNRSYANTGWANNGTVTITDTDSEGLITMGTVSSGSGRFLSFSGLVIGQVYNFSLWAGLITGSVDRVMVEGSADSSLNSQIDGTFKKCSATFIATGTVQAITVYLGPNSKLRFGRVQVEPGNLSTSLIKTTGTVLNRSADVLSLTQPGVKSIYREYIPLGQSTLIKEYVLYNGTLCPPGHIQKLKAWNRVLTNEEVSSV